MTEMFLKLFYVCAFLVDCVLHTTAHPLGELSSVLQCHVFKYSEVDGYRALQFCLAFLALVKHIKGETITSFRRMITIILKFLYYRRLLSPMY